MRLQKIIIAFFFVFGFVKLSHAQDIIILKKGGQIQAKILEVTATDVKFKRFDNQEGPTIVKAKSEISMLKYKDGRKVSFTEVNGAQPTTPVVPPKKTTVMDPDIIHTTNGKELIVVVDNITDDEYIYRLFTEQSGDVLKINKNKVEYVEYSKTSRFYVAAAAKPAPTTPPVEEPVKKQPENPETAKAKDDLDAKTAKVQDEEKKEKQRDFPAELELSYSYGTLSAATNQYSNLVSINSSYKYEDAYTGASAPGSVSYGILARHRLVGFWYLHYGANYTSIVTENNFKSTLADDPEYKERSFRDEITTIGIPVGFTFYTGAKNHMKFYFEGGMLTNYTLDATDELYEAVYDLDPSEAKTNTATFSFNPYGGGGLRFKIGNRGRLNIGANYFFENIGNLSTLEGVTKTTSGLMFKAGIAIGLGSND